MDHYFRRHYTLRKQERQFYVEWTYSEDQVLLQSLTDQKEYQVLLQTKGK